MRWLRSQLGLVSQEPSLFRASIAENVAYGKEGATPAEVDAALDAAHASGFVAALERGSATEVGERGVTLSGGQKQRARFEGAWEGRQCESLSHRLSLPSPPLHTRRWPSPARSLKTRPCCCWTKRRCGCMRGSAALPLPTSLCCLVLTLAPPHFLFPPS